MENFKGLEVVIWGSIIRCKVYAFVSCKVNFCPNYFTIRVYILEGFRNNVVTEGYKDSSAVDIPVLSYGLIVGWEERIYSIVCI